MTQSSYIEIYKLFAEAIISKLHTQGEPLDSAGSPRYLHKLLLTPERSIDGRFDTASYISANFAADLVAMNSPLPLKSRPSVGRSTGEIVKMGVMYQLFEDELSKIDEMMLKGATNAEIARKLLENSKRAITAIEETCEAMFLQGLSSGFTEVADADNVGVAVRLDFGYLPENKFNVAELWADPKKAKPLSDVRKVLKKAEEDGHIVTDVYMDTETFDQFARAEEVRAYYASRRDIATPPAVLSSDRISEELRGDSDFGFTIHRVNRVIRRQRDGQTTTYRPWEAGKVVFTCSQKVGMLSYAQLAEENHPAEHVRYSKGGEHGHILVSLYRLNNPLQEVTSAQARVTPVIGNVGEIYQLDAKTKA